MLQHCFETVSWTGIFIITDIVQRRGKGSATNSYICDTEFLALTGSRGDLTAQRGQKKNYFTRDQVHRNTKKVILGPALVTSHFS